jgi:hypothetical protein
LILIILKFSQNSKSLIFMPTYQSLGISLICYRPVYASKRVDAHPSHRPTAAAADPSSAWKLPRLANIGRLTIDATTSSTLIASASKALC